MGGKGGDASHAKERTSERKASKRLERGRLLSMMMVVVMMMMMMKTMLMLTMMMMVMMVGMVA